MLNYSVKRKYICISKKKKSKVNKQLSYWKRGFRNPQHL